MSEERQRDGLASGPSRLELMQKALFEPFNNNKRDSARILSDLAPVIMTPRMIHSASTYSSRTRSSTGNSTITRSKVDFATIGRAPLRLGLGSKRITSRDLEIVESTDELLGAEVPELGGVASDVSLLRGFNATIPSAEKSRSRRRQLRNVETPRLGLKKLGLSARGLMSEEEDHESQSVVSEEDVVVVSPSKIRKTRGIESLRALKTLGREELDRQIKEIKRDKENLHVKRSLIHSEITEITDKIEVLNSVRVKLQQDLLKLQEEDLELDDELLGVKERSVFEKQQISEKQKLKYSVTNFNLPASSRRRKGPAFLPSEHDDLPPGVAFMTLDSHTTPITSLDFSEPYGILVSASQEDALPRVWDLFSGTEIGRLRGHRGTVKCLQVEDRVCLTGGEDGSVRLWDLRRVENGNTWGEEVTVGLSDVVEEDEGAGQSLEHKNSIRNGDPGLDVLGKDGSCIRVLEGHSRAVTALFFEDQCLVTGASDKTLRQWDLTTGQCVMTMDILWAISHSSNTTSVPSSAVHSSQPGPFSFPTPPYADGSWELYEDFVGGVQFWGYGLVSGSGDGAVRMWDMRTGQTHRALNGHTAPVTCLQFDEIHVVSGSLDKTIRIWDLRTGGTFETIKFNHPVNSLQFDTRKVIAATGENGIKVHNRTTMQQTTLVTNGHTKPVDRIRYMDRYLISGGRDSMLKIWSL